MKRARIKAVATLPVRRKHLVQDTLKAATENKQEEIKTNDNLSIAIPAENQTKKNIESEIKEDKNVNEKECTAKSNEEKVEKNEDTVKENVGKVKENVKEAKENHEICKENTEELKENLGKRIEKKESNENVEVKEIVMKRMKDVEEIQVNDKKMKEVVEKERIILEIEENNEITFQELRKHLEKEDKSKECNENNSNESIHTECRESIESDEVKEDTFERKDSSQPPEGSPLKLMSNRLSFTKPTPRLDGMSRIRRNSMCGSGHSASESEDDSRRTPFSSRVRHDSVSSVQNCKESSAAVNISNTTGLKRRPYISASAKKLADARREFFFKYENKTPDKSKLKMYDLIYYNPIGSPMKKSASGPKFVTNTPKSSNEEESEENVDDPQSMPVPQVKVGPNGQIILDQQSLVIKQTKSKGTIDRSNVIVDDEYSNGGFYKRRRASKEWNKWETLKFYKALNSIGTDFLLMQNFFPKRTRQELKLKYKKEERINGSLVEKALSKYGKFDTDFLKKELLIFEENEKKEKEEKLTEKKSKSERKGKSRRRKKKEDETASTECVDADDEHENENENENGNDNERENTSNGSKTTIENNNNCFAEKEVTTADAENSFQKESPMRGRKLTKRRILSNMLDSGESGDSDSEMEIYKPKPTRSGRVPKVRKLQAPDINTLDNQFIEKKLNGTNEENDNPPSHPKTMTELRSLIPDVDKIEPGSLVILTKGIDEQPGKNYLQIYMVNANSETNKEDITPIDLTPELLATVTTRMTEVDMFHS